MRKNLQLAKSHKIPTNFGGLQARQKGAVLLEALIAILIFSFGILAISGLQGAMMKNVSDATYRAEAAYIVQQRVGNMLINPIALAQGTNIPVPSLPGGLMSITPVPGAGGLGGRVNIAVTWQTPGEVDVAGIQIVHNYQAVSSIFTR